MGKVKVLTSDSGVAVELGSFFTWWEVGPVEDGTIRTSVCVDGEDPRRSTVTPKQLRKIAKAIRALANEVDPPAPKVEYYQTGDPWGHTFRIVDGGQPDLWIGRVRNHPSWEPAWAFTTAAELRAHRGIQRIRRSDLPEEAR